MSIKNKIVLTLFALAVLLPGVATAITPANTTLTNTAQLNYTGLTSPIEASVSVTVALTPSAPTLSTPPDQTTAENQTVDYTYTITSNANGGDVYELLNGGNPSVLTPNADMQSTSPAPTFFQGIVPITSVTLGATAADTFVASGNATISVPSDGTADASVNGLEAGDTVVIGGTEYTIAAGGISDDGTNASITLTSNLTADVNVGDLISERQTFTARIPDVGTVVAAPVGTPQVDMDVFAVSQADNTEFATDETITTVVEVVFNKYVRNVTTPNGPGGGAVSIHGSNFYSTGGAVTAKSTEVLEYALVVTAPAGSALAGVVLSDVIPAFTTYVASSTTLNNVWPNTTGSADIAGVSPLIAGMTVNDAGSVLNSGDVQAAASATVTFRVTVD